jgi:PAS domain S-box-containing protein/putative nucleotidyltransferase with HDIG domain
MSQALANMPGFLYRIRTRLLLIVILAIIPSIALTVINATEARHQAENNIQEDLQNLTLLLTEEEKHIFNDERTLLISLSGLPEIRFGDTPACNQRLSSILTANPDNLNLGVIDKNGEIFCSALPINGPVTVSDRSYYQHALEFRDFSVGNYQIGRITQKPSINFGMPILEERGEINRVVFGALDLGYLDRLFQQATLPKGATVTLLDRNGIILARFPEADKLLGEQLSSQSIFSAIQKQGGNGSLESPGLDGVNRLFAFNRLRVSQQTTDTFLLVGVPKDIAYASVNQLLQRNLIGIALASILALIAAWLIGNLAIARPVDSLIAATHRLASGKLDERIDQLTGRGELNQLGLAFNDMASALEKRELEMRNAHAALQESEQHYRTVFEDVPVGLYRTAPDGEILDANPALLEMFGYPDLETIRAVNAKDIYASASDREHLAALLDQQEIVRDFETQFYRYDGKIIWVRDTVRAIRDAHGQLEYYEGSLQDVTNYKLAVEELRRSAIRSQALARISNRLNVQLDLDTVARAVCEEAARALGIAAVSICWYDEQHKCLFHSSAVNLPLENKNWIQPRSISPELYAKFSLDENRIVVLDGGSIEAEPFEAETRDLGFNKIILARLARQSELIGTINLYLHEDDRMIDEEGLDFLGSLADQATQAVINARLFEDARQRLERLASLHRIDIAIASSSDIQVTLNVILEQVITRLNVDAADFLIFNPVTGILNFAVGMGFRTDALKHTHLKLGDGYAGIAALERRLIFVQDLTDQNLEFYRSPFFVEENFISYYAVPLLAKGSVKGVLEIFLRSQMNSDREWTEFLDSLGGQAAIAIESVALFDGLQRRNIDLSLAYETTLEGWSRALDLRDRETEGHTQRVTRLTLRLAREMNMSDEELVHARRGALLHDIGKMGVPDSILHKPGPLTNDEWEVMRKHPVYAFELLAPIEFLRPAIAIPYCHHEKWDGSGYPRGLRAEQIPLTARIFAVVDVWDALTSDRPYRKAWEEGQALEYIREQAGLHFDPKVVEVFLNTIERGL